MLLRPQKESEHKRRDSEFEMPSDLEAHWYGDDTTDSKWTDRAGNGHHATLVGSPTLSANGLTTTSGKYATVPDTPSLGASAGTLCAWVYPTASLTASIRIFLGGWKSPTEYYLGTVTTTAAAGGINNVTANSIAAVAEDTWQHLALRWDGDDITISVDGAKGTPVTQETGSTAAHLMYLGTYDATNYPWVGDMDDVMIFSQCLSDADLADVRANSPGSHAA
jgi:hypothetical protein